MLSRYSLIIKRRLSVLAIGSLLASPGLIAVESVVGGTTAYAVEGLCAVNTENASEEWLARFSIGGEDVTATQGTTYSDYSETSMVGLTAGETYNLELEVYVDATAEAEAPVPFDEFVFAWLDLNQDGTVDLEAEEIFSGYETTDNFDRTGDPLTYTFSGTFTVPADAYNGVSYGRAMLQYVGEGDPVLCNPDGSETAYEYGSIIDFSVTIAGGVRNPENPVTSSSDEREKKAPCEAVGIFLTVTGEVADRTSSSPIVYGSCGLTAGAPYSLTVEPMGSVGAKRLLGSGAIPSSGALERTTHLPVLDAGNYKVVLTSRGLAGEVLTLTNHVSVSGDQKYGSISAESLQPHLK